MGLRLPEDVITYVAENITSNVRQLEGTVNKIMAYRDMTDFEINRTMWPCHPRYGKGYLQ